MRAVPLRSIIVVFHRCSQCFRVNPHKLGKLLEAIGLPNKVAAFNQGSELSAPNTHEGNELIEFILALVGFNMRLIEQGKDLRLRSDCRVEAGGVGVFCKCLVVKAHAALIDHGERFAYF